jgi:hypothetical protein
MAMATASTNASNPLKRVRDAVRQRGAEVTASDDPDGSRLESDLI